VWCWLVSVAVAHPFGSAAAAHRLEATVGADGLEATWSVDVPNTVILAGAHSPEDGFRRMQAEIVSGIAIRADGADLAIRKEPSEPTRSDDESFIFPVRVTATWEHPPSEIAFEDGNLIDLRGFFRSDIQIGPGLSVLRTSVLPMDEEGVPIVDHSGRWREGSEYRRVEMALRPRWARGSARPISEALIRPSEGLGRVWFAVGALLLALGAILRRVSRVRGG
jgi:hypothetical protein